jgi:hypothetical protein
MDKIEKGEIVYCDLIVIHKKKEYKLEKVVYKYKDGFYHNKTVLSKYKINESPLVKEIKIIKRLGFENTSSEYTEVQKSEEKRNLITGAYE